MSSLKKKDFFQNFEFDKLNDFKLKAPYKPSKHSFDKYLKETNPYENYVKEDNTLLNKKRGKENEEIPPDYDPHWADEF